MGSKQSLTCDRFQGYADNVSSTEYWSFTDNINIYSGMRTRTVSDDPDTNDTIIWKYLDGEGGGRVITDSEYIESLEASRARMVVGSLSI